LTWSKKKKKKKNIIQKLFALFLFVNFLSINNPNFTITKTTNRKFKKKKKKKKAEQQQQQTHNPQKDKKLLSF